MEERLQKEAARLAEAARQADLKHDKTAAEKIKALQEGFAKAKKLFAKLALPVAKIGLRAAAAWASAGASETIGTAIKAAGENAEQAADIYWQQQKNKQSAIEQFHATLAEVAKERKLVIIIDELDRARPDYALSVLETIKHFFNVDGVYFILGVNMEALESMVKRRYGDEINARIYLQRFISLSLTLPDIIQQEGKSKKAVLAYTQWAAAKMGIRGQLQHMLLNHLSCAVKNNPISLRDAGRILSRFSLTINALGAENFLQLPIAVGEICLTLLTSAIINPDYHAKFLSATVKHEEILKYYGVTEAGYENPCNHFRNILTNPHIEDGLLTRFEFIQYFKSIQSYLAPNNHIRSSEEDTPCRSAFMWEALSKFATQRSEKTNLQARDLAQHLGLNNYSPQFSIPAYIEEQYLNICSPYFIGGEGSSTE